SGGFSRVPLAAPAVPATKRRTVCPHAPRSTSIHGAPRQSVNFPCSLFFFLVQFGRTAPSHESASGPSTFMLFTSFIPDLSLHHGDGRVAAYVPPPTKSAESTDGGAGCVRSGALHIVPCNEKLAIRVK